MRTISDELAQRLTEQFISENPSEIVIRRRLKTRTDAGGHKWGPAADLAPQILRKVPHSGPKTPTTNSNGKTVIPTWMIMGPMGANIQRFDLFTILDVEYEVLAVDRKATMQRTVAEVVEYG